MQIHLLIISPTAKLSAVGTVLGNNDHIPGVPIYQLADTDVPRAITHRVGSMPATLPVQAIAQAHIDDPHPDLEGVYMHLRDDDIDGSNPYPAVLATLGLTKDSGVEE